MGLLCRSTHTHSEQAKPQDRFIFPKREIFPALTHHTVPPVILSATSHFSFALFSHEEDEVQFLVPGVCAGVRVVNAEDSHQQSVWHSFLYAVNSVHAACDGG